MLRYISETFTIKLTSCLATKTRLTRGATVYHTTTFSIVCAILDNCIHQKMQRPRSLNFEVSTVDSKLCESLFSRRKGLNAGPAVIEYTFIL